MSYSKSKQYLAAHVSEIARNARETKPESEILKYRDVSAAYGQYPSRNQMPAIIKKINMAAAGVGIERNDSTSMWKWYSAAKRDDLIRLWMCVARQSEILTWIKRSKWNKYKAAWRKQWQICFELLAGFASVARPKINNAWRSIHLPYAGEAAAARGIKHRKCENQYQNPTQLSW